MAASRGTCILVGLAVLAGLPAAAEESRSSTLPLVALDSSGKPVMNLKATDLEINEDGDSRRITSLEFRGTSPRSLAIFLDDYHVAAGHHTQRAVEIARTLLDRAVNRGDTLFVVRPLDAHESIAPVAGIDEARQHVAAFRGRRDDFTPASRFETEFMSSAPAAVAHERIQIVSSALQSLAVAMREPLDGTKALVIITEGFVPDERRRARTATLRTLARVARLANIAIYVIDPSAQAPRRSMPGDGWHALASETAGALLGGDEAMETSISRVASDLSARYLLRFQTASVEDGAFHPIGLRVKRPRTIVRAPAGYWAPLPAERLAAPAPGRSYAALLTPHVSGLIQPWFRMAPGRDGRTRVTFLWSRKPTGGRADVVDFAAVTFEGARIHEAAVHTRDGREAADLQTTFEVLPGPLQISMAVSAGRRLLDTDVRYLDVPRFFEDRPVIAGVEFIRPRSLPEFTALRADAGAVPTDVRDFVRQDRLLVRVRAFAAQKPATAEVWLLNRNGQVLMPLPGLEPIADAAQFELPLARFPRGEYRLEVRVTAGGAQVSQLIPIRLIG